MHELSVCTALTVLLPLPPDIRDISVSVCVRTSAYTLPLLSDHSILTDIISVSFLFLHHFCTFITTMHMKCNNEMKFD